MKRNWFWMILILVMALGLTTMSACALGGDDDDDDDDDDLIDDDDDTGDDDDDTGDDDDDDTGDDDDDDDDDDSDSIYDIQQGEFNEGDVVTVVGVVVSPTDFKGETFFIMDEDGGAYSGVAIYMWSEMADEYDGEMGDKVRVIGEVTEFFDMTEIVVKEAGGVEVIGSGDIPDPEALDIGDIDEEWESVLVEISDVTVTDGVNEYGEFVVSDAKATQIIDDLFFAKVGDLYYFEDMGVDVGDSFASIAGVVNYSYEEFKLCPREGGDLSD